MREVITEKKNVEIPRRRARNPVYLPAFRIAVAIVIAAVIVFLIWHNVSTGSQIDKGLAYFKRAYAAQRPLEARLSYLEYAPIPDSTRGDEPQKIDRNSRDLAERLFLEEKVDHPGVASYHALGLSRLANRQFDEAITDLRKAAAEDQYNAEIQSDLGAALLEKGKVDQSAGDTGKSLQEYAVSLEHLNKAVGSNGSLLEALFNRAVLHQQMMLPKDAESDWNLYLQKDSSSKWADEARRNLQTIKDNKQKISRTADSDRQLLLDFLGAGQYEEKAWNVFVKGYSRTGNVISDQLVDKYLDSFAKGDNAPADASLNALSFAGSLLSGKGDHSISDLAARLKQMKAADLAVVTDARKQSRQGLADYDHGNLDTAIQNYENAKKAFLSAGDKYEALFTDYLIANAYLLKPELEKSMEAYQSIVSKCDKTNYRWLQAQSMNMIAGIHTANTNYSEAIEVGEKFVEIATALNDYNSVARGQLTLSQLYRYISNYSRSLDFGYHAVLLDSGQPTDAMQRWRDYFFSGMSMALLGYQQAAMEYEKEASQLADESGRPVAVSRSYSVLALMYANQNDRGRAIEAINQAVQSSEKIQDTKTRNEMQAFSLLHLGRVQQKVGAFQDAINAYDRSIAIYANLKFPAYDYLARKGKLISCLSLSECPTADQQISETFALFENYRSKILEESNRDAFFDTEQDICDIAIGFEYSKKSDDKRALDYSERCRARSLSDLRKAGGIVKDNDIKPTKIAEPKNTQDLLRLMPPDTQILEYSVLKDAIVIWIISRSDIRSRRIEIKSEELKTNVETFFAHISVAPTDNPLNIDDEAKYLYGVLIQPIAQLLEKDKAVCIVPDKYLYRLPFEALLSPVSGKYLLEEFPVQISPSANIFVSATLENATAIKATTYDLLSVGDSNFDRNVYPTLQRLPDARRESQDIARNYKHPLILVDKNAVKDAVVRQMPNARVINLALHAVTDPQNPLKSKLLLSRNSASANPDLEAIDIVQLDLSSTRLAVLSACSSGVERYFNGEGMIGLSRAFIVAGVPTTVASLWPVDSGSSANLMIAFHKNLTGTKGIYPVEALRRAQLEMLHASDGRFHSPYYWAPFTVIGGYTRVY